MRFGRLTFIRELDKVKGNARWECRCDCGTVKAFYANGLRAGLTKSCGCGRKVKARDIDTIRARFEAGYEPVTESGCWIWTEAYTKPSGKIMYGKLTIFWNDRQVTMSTHRLSWLLHRGEIPEGLFVCHKCDVPLCVNPDHLFLGTAKDNISDMYNKGRQGGFVPPPSYGESHGNSILTEDDVRAIRRDCRSAKIVAAEYGTSKTNVIGIRSGERWSWLDQGLS